VQTLASFSCVDWLLRAARAASLVVALSLLAIPGTAVSADVLDSAWFIDGTGAAIQIFDCSGLLCDRIIWLHKATMPLGSWPTTTRTRIRHSGNACCAA